MGEPGKVWARMLNWLGKVLEGPIHTGHFCTQYWDIVIVN